MSRRPPSSMPPGPSRSSMSSSMTCSTAPRSAAPASTSAQVRGPRHRQVPSTQRIGADRRLGCDVLRPVEEDLAGRKDLVIFHSTRSGCLAVILASCCARSRTWSLVRSPPKGGIELHALRATGHREELQTQTPRRSLRCSATWQHFVQMAGLPGSRSMTRRLGFCRSPSSSTVHWGTWSRVAEVDQIGSTSAGPA